ncbi:hypothetical protein MOQ72_27095 [Saccharopolyspora sp. K220]|uniref:hypothetical protein n=1 Tax=Saccharopolyspora soli TaxID=2926618 RepID=UPI001F5A0352|nr:hypothetical protein [Saccharopolyspora soli]MCI2421115.1 hypothetical protein [Saccharopolyspora soli]
MNEVPVTIRQLTHDTRSVFARLRAEGRLAITNAGQVVAYLEAPDPDEQQLSEWAASGEAPADWRDRQQGLRSFLATAPVRTAAVGEPTGSAAILADREDTDR